ncbi:hypothetical protein [Burkholderia ubonensis]|uniref:Transposase IS111A/IS1328/IS1533 N-terminal domain-containing protein n=1 Tax=Burkholderia ubonensis TaxID=101571 RepID=A0AAW3NDL4_9BURK|nr:hypothetical protein [Burkholderia ubonensis]KVT51493.1 hypothetical protein WK53_08605 [Burkholderia ubonensis]
MEHDSTLYVGLDVHKESITAAYALGMGEVELLGTFATGVCSSEQVVAATNGQLAFILPISGKKLKSIIVGIRCMVAASRFETSSNAAAAAWCMSTPALA